MICVSSSFNSLLFTYIYIHIYTLGIQRSNCIFTTASAYTTIPEPPGFKAIYLIRPESWLSCALKKSKTLSIPLSPSHFCQHITHHHVSPPPPANLIPTTITILFFTTTAAVAAASFPRKKRMDGWMMIERRRKKMQNAHSFTTGGGGSSSGGDDDDSSDV